MEQATEWSGGRERERVIGGRLVLKEIVLMVDRAAALPAVVRPGVSLSFLCSRQLEAPRKAGFAMCGSWG